MVVYSIKDIEKMSGVKAHTLRIWEKRYNIVTPKRTATNIRYYTEEDLRRILNVCFLYKKGYKISKIAEMPMDTLKEKVSNYSTLELDFEDKLDVIMLFILQLDSYNFSGLLDQHISQTGLEDTMNDLIYPLMDKLGVAWLAGSFLSVHESFVSQIIKSKINACIEQLEETHSSNKKYMIFLPPSEQQELSLSYFHFILKKYGCRVVHLGNDVILSDMIFANENCRPDFVFTILNEEIPNMPIQSYVDQLAENINEARLLLTGYQIVSTKVDWPENVTLLRDLGESIAFVMENNK